MRWQGFEKVHKVRRNYSFRNECAAVRYDCTKPGIAIDVWNYCSAITYCARIRALGGIALAKTVSAIPDSEVKNYRVVFLLEPCLVLRDESLWKRPCDLTYTDYVLLSYRFCDINRKPVSLEEIFEPRSLTVLSGDCLACSHSMSEPGENDGDDDKLFCVVKQVYVIEDGSCEEFN